jgi:transcriptional regulator with GAF, ATPase, and Fis domain
VFNKTGAFSEFAEEMVGRSPAFQYVLNQVRIVAKTDSVTLIQGETTCVQTVGCAESL